MKRAPKLNGTALATNGLSKASKKAVSHDPSYDIMSLNETAKFLRVSEAALLVEATAGRIPARQIDGEWRFLRGAITTWLKSPQPPSELPSGGIWKDYDEDPEEFIKQLKNAGH